MNAAEFLKPFCGDEERHKSPWRIGDYAYATNGIVAVRIPADDSVAEIPDCADGWLWFVESARKIDFLVEVNSFIDIPEFTLYVGDECSRCCGSGKTSKCRECDGDGELELESDYNLYEVCCKSCDGSGARAGGSDICHLCYGAGKEGGWVLLGKQYIAMRLWSLVNKLPGLKCHLSDDPAADVVFQFDGGRAVIATLRVRQ